MHDVLRKAVRKFGLNHPIVQQLIKGRGKDKQKRKPRGASEIAADWKQREYASITSWHNQKAAEMLAAGKISKEKHDQIVAENKRQSKAKKSQEYNSLKEKLQKAVRK